MTSAIAEQQQPTLDANAAAAPPRKRRRRTGAGGAQDDCFACRKRAVPCDRKRPYCTQCIDIGKECSGYKTTLTWGVGVASRGKLRGLSCPIANKNVDGSNIGSASTGGVTKRRKSSVVAPKIEPIPETPVPSRFPLATSPERSQSFPPASVPIPIPQPHNAWQAPGFQDHAALRTPGDGRMAPPQRLQTAISPQFEHGQFPMSAVSVGSFAEEWHSPMEYPHTPGSIMFPDHFQQQSMTSYMDHPSMSSSADSYQQSLGSSLDSLQSTSSYDEVPTLDPSTTDLITFNPTLFGDAFLSGPNQRREEETIDESQLSLLSSARFSTPFFYLTPRLQSLLNYYDQNICPFLVAFDGPSNPYRMHIIQLASQNEGLQNAIAALSTNNMRMRRLESRKTGFVEEITEAFDGQDITQPTAEESCYKQVSIEQLNMQLADPRAAQDDSVLATLLILCLFHVCDSGFSKFKTQLAGVQKLMSLRNPATQSHFTRWVEMFFTWFDVMTSAVNDRETQIQSDGIDMLDFSANLGALEQFSGCDGRLFKLIARLGRLNLLSQGREVRPQPPPSGERTPRAGATPTPPPKHSSARPRRVVMKRGPRSLSLLDYEFIDGNGWGSPIVSSPSDSDNDAPASPAIEDPSRPAYDERKEFWAEWHDIRIRLQGWQMAPASFPAPEGSPEYRDLVHISESFRHSALLYITRLAHPFLPSSAPQFQMLVGQALYHITSLPVTSCVNKFLLWPLFVTGTECVDPQHRDVIRVRCVEIQRESGFFNNLSGLEVLERVWRDGDLGGEGEEGARRRDSEVREVGGGGAVVGGAKTARVQAFRWRRAMDRVDGEYIVI